MSSAPAQEPVLLLGVCDGEIPARYRCSHRTNKAGGAPDWPPPKPRPRCRRCRGVPALVLQLYCPLVAAPPQRRNLHLLCCARCGGGEAGGGWLLLRTRGPEEGGGPGAPEPPPREPTAPTEWCEGADEWGEEEVTPPCSSSSSCEPDPTLLSDGLQQLGLGVEMNGGGSDVDVDDDDALLAQYQPLFISVLEESDLWEEEQQLEHARELLREYERGGGAVGGTTEDEEDEDGSSSRKGSSKERYEKDGPKHGDAVFWRFLKAVAPCPQQVLRYQRGGAPLWARAPPAPLGGAVPPCGLCGGPRTFEAQLMPALVSLLQTRAPGAPPPPEFGTVLLFTCAADCGPPGRGPLTAEEFCLVQDDPDQQLFS